MHGKLKNVEQNLPLLIGVATLIFSFQFAHPFQAPKIFGFLVVFLLLPHRLNQPISKGWVLLLFWLIWPVVQPIVPMDPLPAIYQRGLWLVYLMVVLLIGPLGESNRMALRKGLGLAGVGVAVYGFIQRVGWDWLSLETPGSPTSFMGNTNFSAHFLLLCWCLAVFSFKRSEWVGKSIIALGMLNSQSRAVIGIWLVLCFFQWVAQQKYRKSLILLGLVTCLAVVVVFRYDLKTFASYVQKPHSYSHLYNSQPDLIEARDPWFQGKRLSLIARVSLWSNTLGLVEQYPFLGVGAGQFRSYYPSVSQTRFPDVLLNHAYRATSPHNLILELSVAFGLPWLLIGIWLLVKNYSRWQDSFFKQAILSQLALAMVSLNYLSPVIIIVLIMMAPQQREPIRSMHASNYWKALWLLPLLAVVGLDGWHGSQLKQTEWQRVNINVPDHRARLAMQQGAIVPAWHAQKAALKQDPFGPETLFNACIMLWNLSEKYGVEGRDLAIAGLFLVVHHFPEFQPAENRLIETVNAGFWDNSWDSYGLQAQQNNALADWRERIYQWPLDLP